MAVFFSSINPFDAPSPITDYRSRYPELALAFGVLYLIFPVSTWAAVVTGAKVISFGWIFVSIAAVVLACGAYRVRRRMHARTEEVARLNRELYERQRQLTTLISNLPGMVYRCRNDDAWTIEFASDGCRKLTGYEPQDLLHNAKISYADLIHPEDREHIQQSVQKALATRVPFQLNYRVKTRNGAERWFWDQGCGVWNDAGELLFLEGFVTDVTAQCEAQADSARLDGHIRLLLESTGEGIYGVDQLGRCTFINHAGANMLGFRPDELRGRNLHELFHQQHLEPHTASALNCPICERHHTGSEVRDEILFWHREGHAIQVECRFSPIREKGAVTGAVVCFVDVSKRKASEARLQQLSQALQQSSSAVMITDLLGRIEYINCSFARLTGYGEDELLGKHYSMLHSISAAQQAEVQRALDEHGEWRGEVHNQRRDGSFYWARKVISTIRSEDGKPLRYLFIKQDVTATREAEEALRKSQHRLAEAQRIGAMGNWELDLITGEIWWSDELYRIFGISSHLRMNFELFASALHPEDRARVLAAIEAAKERKQIYNIEYRIVRSEGDERVIHAVGEMLFDESGRAMLMQGTAQDITERKSAEQRLHHLAYYDDLTCLPNRALFTDRVERAMLEAKRHGRPVAVLFMDLDRFKQINETMGHEVGDVLLKGVAQRLRACVRDVDSVARMGGDNFTVLLRELGDGQEAALVARKILDSLQAPFTVNEQELTITASIGISVYPTDGESVQTLLKNADAAMDYSKERGRNNYQFYSSHMTVTAFERIVLESSLRKALERDEFELHYQPQLSVENGRVIGCEALLRWRHPELGLISPLRFIPLAEDTGLIIPITEWALRTACLQAQAWRAAGMPAMRMAVNISSRHFREAGLDQMVERVLTETGTPPEYLELELTESVIMEYTDATVQTIGRLWAIGVQLALDDFGTGYSSLSYLKRFPMHVLKVDRSFIKDLTTDSGDAALTRAIIVMAHSLEMQVVAEGVETAEQLEYLRAEGCDFIQGYYYSPPCPSAEFERLLRSGRGLYASPAGVIAIANGPA